MLHTWKPLHSLSISHVFRTEGAPCLPAEEQSKLPHGDQRERKGQNMPAHTLGGLSFEDSFFPGQDCWWVVIDSVLSNPKSHTGLKGVPCSGSGRVRQRGVQAASCDSFSRGSCGSCSGVWSRAILQNRDCFDAQGDLRLQTPQHTLRICSLPHQHHCCPTASAAAEENAVQLHCRLQEGPRKTRTLCC